jgi:hypothetical protein
MPEGPQFTNCIDKENWKSSSAWVGVAITAAVAAIVAVIAGFPPAGVILAFAAGAEILRKVAEWLLNGKLICLNNVKRRVFDDPDPDRICVLGTVLDFEKVGQDKSGFATIDNDFAINLFIAPFPISDVDLTDHDTLKRRMENSPQGDLIQNPDAKPVSGEPDPGPGPLKRKDDPLQNFGPMPIDPPIFSSPKFGFSGYERGLMISASFPRPIPSNTYRDPNELVKVDPKFKQIGDDAYVAFVTEFQGEVIENGQPLSKDMKDAILADAAKDPLADEHVSAKFYKAVEAAFHFKEKYAQALHCEFEGSRIRDVYNALDFAHVHCDASGFWGFLCDVLNLVISVFLGIPKLIAAAVAWANADDGSLSNSFDGKGGEILLGDPIVVRGRWVFDSAHSGYNEIHAVRTVQKTGPAPRDPVEFVPFHNFWCAELSRVPPSPPPPRDPQGSPPPTGGDIPMTPDQRDTWDAQNRDENRWVYHPAIDGCARSPGRDADPLH